MKLIEILIIIFSVTIVASVVIASYVKRKKNKKNGNICSGYCSECPYNCKHKSSN